MCDATELQGRVLCTQIWVVACPEGNRQLKDFGIQGYRDEDLGCVIGGRHVAESGRYLQAG